MSSNSIVFIQVIALISTYINRQGATQTGSVFIHQALGSCKCEQQLHRLNLNMNATDFMCGLVAGWSQIIIGQPFDFIKVRIQTAVKSPPTIPQIVKDIYSEYGLRGFYRGASSLFFGFAFTIGTQFLIYEWAKRQIHQTWGKRSSEYSPVNLRIWQIGLAGGIVGGITSLIYCPVEYVKIQKQVSSKIQVSALKLLFKQFRNHGSRNIYKGFLATVSRQIFGSILYYGSYESVVRAYTKQNREAATDQLFLGAGAIAGLTYHFFTYPIDTIKTNIQAGKEWRQAVRMSLQWSKLKGYKVVLTRAVIVNSCSFLIYEKAQRQVRRFNEYYYSIY